MLRQRQRHRPSRSRWATLLLLILALFGVIKATSVTTTAGGAKESEAQSSQVANPKETSDSQSIFDEANELISSLRPLTRQKSFRRKSSGPDDSSWLRFIRVVRRLFMQSLFKAERPDQYEDFRPAVSVKNEKLSTAHEKLQQAIDLGNTDAMYILAELSFHGVYAPRNYTAAFNAYKALADATGNATAQQMLGFMYATGIGGVVDRNQGQALLYHTFAAFGGDTAAEMTLGYRHLMGIGTPTNCEDAVFFYKRVAKKAIDYFESGPPGGRSLPAPRIKLAEDQGGVYGYGTAGDRGHSDTTAAVDDILEYYKLFADKGQVRFQLHLGRTYYEGTRDVPRNFDLARYWFLAVARQYWPRADELNSEQHSTHERSDIAASAGVAASYLGRMHWRGEGVPQDNKTALFWFSCGQKVGDPAAQNALGLMHLEGVTVPKNLQTAMQYFRQSAEQDYSEGQVNLGKMYLAAGETGRAFGCFDSASQKGNFLAYYYLAEMNDQGIGRPERSCQTAAVFYKVVAERGDWQHSPFPAAYAHYMSGNKEAALVHYLMAAERGYEAGQVNVAWLLDPDKSLLRFESDPSSSHDFAELALIYWTRAANLRYIDALVKMGDYHLKGIGTSPDATKAAACYQAAVEEQQSAMAAWNLGWMHENGIGVTQDFHLAKRFYDQALEINVDAYVPVTLSLIKLHFRSFWNSITGGKINGISAPSKSGSWDLHRVVDEIYKRWTEDERPSAFSDVAETSEDAARINQQPDPDYSEYDPVAGGEFYDEVDDEDLFESLLILGLCLIVGYLVYIRQFRFRQEQQHQQQQQQQQQQRGQRQQNDGAWPQDPVEQARWQAGAPL